MLNNVSLQGRLVADPELHQTQNGKSVASIRIACDRGYKDSNGNKITDWLNATAWAGTAEFIAKYFGKGDMILISGRLQSRQYQDKNGNNRTATEINISEVNFAGSKSNGNNSEAAYSMPDVEYSEPANQNSAHTDTAKRIEASSSNDFGMEVIEDEGDLPF